MCDDSDVIISVSTIRNSLPSFLPLYFVYAFPGLDTG